ncbi:transposable element Tcb2 transposase [Trichonephila clavipes]|nr:transposable element Tcb2 transposase [Trichonephila clavipes]
MKKENFIVHPVHETVSLGANGTKVIGLSWNTNEDYLTTNTKSLLEFVSLDKNTKRFILQVVGKIFDPLGLISPFTVRMKCLLQDLWKEEIQWDDPLPTHIEKEWEKWCEELPHLRNLKIPRLVLDSTLLEDDVELHSFCDASKKAYGAAIYLKTKSRNGISVKLVTSKSRVAPLNCITLPRLELLGALVAARLASKDEVEKLAYQLNEEAEQTERPIRRLSKVMYGSTSADMQVDVMGDSLSSIKHVVGREVANNQSVRRHLDAFTRGRIIGKLNEGRSVTSVAAEFGIAHSIVSRLWRPFQTTGTAIREFRSGRPRGTTPADDRYIVLQARRNRRQTAEEIVRHTTQATGRPISRFTVTRRLHGGGLFCTTHYESRFSLSSDSHRILIWRERGSRNHPSNIIERDRYGGRGVLVWGGIMLGSRTDLHIFDVGSVNGTRYCNEILLPYVRLFRGAMGLQFPFMDDNAPCHRRVAAEQLLESEDIERMDWTARSPDLNPIEHVWDFLGRRLAARTLPPVTIQELRLALQDEWAAMPQQFIDTLILSMGRRCETCLAGNKTRWKQFVAYRVNEITSLTDPHSWYHCAVEENPVDFLSRGLSADCLVLNSRWWTGAEFLSNSEFPKNFQQVVPELDYLTEHEKETVVQERKKLPDVDRSEETVLLFNYNCRNKSKKVGPLTVAEFKESEIKLIKHAQRSLFDKKEIPSSISNLFPFVDGEVIVRVGGRLENASVPYLHKHPAILPKGSKLSKLYFNSLHTRLFRVGPQGLLNAVRQKFWPLSGRSIARKTVHQCVTCFKSRPIFSSQIMGNLPSKRINISSPFTIARLDLCGPFLVKYKNQRKGTLNKVYICVCICFSTKALHLELLSDLTSDALIATLKRFTSRRGKCSKIYTDNATNFVGANSILKKFHKLINVPDENLAKYFVSENIDWKFIPPKSPHFGGLWEAGVKSVKHHLNRAIGNLHFTFEEFETIMIQVEGILNSRPLTPLSSDADNFDVLTPGHFLIGRPITSIPEPNLIDVNENCLSRWEKITKVVQRTWKKWKSDYLNTLQARSKWITEKK